MLHIETASARGNYPSKVFFASSVQGPFSVVCGSEDILFAGVLYGE